MSGTIDPPRSAAGSPPLTLDGLHRAMRDALRRAGIAEHDLDALLLVEHATGLTSLDRLRDPSRTVDPETSACACALLARRLAGEPVHRILGWRDFYGRRFRLTAATLEPRPDTETLVELVLPAARAVAARTGGCRILDLGTGSGILAVTLLCEVASAEAVGVDIATDALETACENARLNAVGERFAALDSDWFAAVSGCYDLIVSNPPYIGQSEKPGPEVVDHDPPLALFAGPDGLDAFRSIFGRAASFLAPRGRIAVEIGYRQKADVIALATDRGFVLERAAVDLGGHDRALLFKARQEAD